MGSAFFIAGSVKKELTETMIKKTINNTKPKVSHFSKLSTITSSIGESLSSFLCSFMLSLNLGTERSSAEFINSEGENTVFINKFQEDVHYRFPPRIFSNQA